MKHPVAAGCSFLWQKMKRSGFPPKGMENGVYQSTSGGQVDNAGKASFIFILCPLIVVIICAI